MSADTDNDDSSKLGQRSTETKIKLINIRDSGGLIFKEPEKEIYFTNSELEQILAKLIGLPLPKNLTIVQRKHWIAYQIIELLGYKKPSGLRTKEAKINKPKFRNQLLDIFVQKHSNLQVWNYIPYAKEYSHCRYLIIRVDDEKILGFIIKTASDLQKWDTTGTQTIKWQATITDTLRKQLRGKIVFSRTDNIFSKFGIKINGLQSLEKRLQSIRELQKIDSSLIKKSPQSDLLISIEELSELLKPILGTKIRYQSEKLIGQFFQDLVADQLGYKNSESTSADSGQIPDITHQLIETKIQISPTIDLGNHLPISNEPITSDWNKNKFSPQDVRYVIGLADKINDETVQVNSIIITDGKYFENYFSFCVGTNFKVQMTIPDFNKI